MKRKFLFLFRYHLLFILIFIVAQSFSVHSQNFYNFFESSEDDFYFEDEYEQFQEDDEYKKFFENKEKDYYINEYEILLLQQKEKARQKKLKNILEEERKLDLKKRLEEERIRNYYNERFHLGNIIYGVFTGGLLGLGLSGEAGNTRDRLRYIGTGLIFGGVLGMIVGYNAYSSSSTKKKSTASKIAPNPDEIGLNLLPINHQNNPLHLFEKKTSLAGDPTNHRTVLAYSFNF